MRNQVLKLKNNYSWITENFLVVGGSFNELPKDSASQIAQDLHRTKFLSRSHEYNAMQERWIKKVPDTEQWELNNDTDPDYSQGNMDARIFSKLPFSSQLQRIIRLIDKKKPTDEEKSLWLEPPYPGVAFIDKKGNDCGFSFCFSPKAPSYFTIAFIRHTRKAPKDREVILFQGTDNQYFGSLEEIAGKAYSHGQLVDQSKIKADLLNIDALPDEILFFIHDCVNEDGSINQEAAKFYKKNIESRSANHEFIEEREKAAIGDLNVYKEFCNGAITQLQCIKTNKLIEHETEQLIQELTQTINKIKQTINQYETNKESGETALFHSFIAVQQRIISHLKAASNDKNYQKGLTSFWQRRKGVFVASSALTILTGAGIALAAIGVLNPVGLAIAAAITATVGLAALVGWGITAYQEAQFANAPKKLEHAVFESLKASKAGISIENKGTFFQSTKKELESQEVTDANKAPKAK